ncbi:MAG: hypothetical protein J7K17_00635 [Candidatus Omnitrophica bacterium]|nr:hypothetical protein [Candidatus Omnitrophota bacterium]
MKVAKALTEVWDWKDRVYKEDKDIPLRESFYRAKGETNKLLRGMGYKKNYLRKDVYQIFS